MMQYALQKLFLKSQFNQMKMIWIFRAMLWLGLTIQIIFERGGVCIYLKGSLSIRFLGVPSNLDECLL